MNHRALAMPVSLLDPDSEVSRGEDTGRSCPTLGQFLTAIGGVLLATLAFGLLARLVSACVM